MSIKSLAGPIFVEQLLELEFQWSLWPGTLTLPALQHLYSIHYNQTGYEVLKFLTQNFLDFFNDSNLLLISIMKY
jgi:hypothetical protein